MAGRFVRSLIAALVVVAALLVCLWLPFSALTGASLVIFRTGSMAPTMPQGSLAITLPVSASEIAVGDVVTVWRDGGHDQTGLPVTHRVVEVRSPAEAISKVGLAADQRELVLKGDDNAVVDFEPYIVDRARTVVVAIPGLGTTMMLAKSPIGMGILTLVAAGLTTFAFWPTRSAERISNANAGRAAQRRAVPS